MTGIVTSNRKQRAAYFERPGRPEGVLVAPLTLKVNQVHQ